MIVLAVEKANPYHDARGRFTTGPAPMSEHGAWMWGFEGQSERITAVAAGMVVGADRFYEIDPHLDERGRQRYNDDASKAEIDTARQMLDTIDASPKVGVLYSGHSHDQARMPEPGSEIVIPLMSTASGRPARPLAEAYAQASPSVWPRNRSNLVMDAVGEAEFIDMARKNPRLAQAIARDLNPPSSRPVIYEIHGARGARFGGDEVVTSGRFHVREIRKGDEYGARYFDAETVAWRDAHTRVVVLDYIAPAERRPGFERTDDVVKFNGVHDSLGRFASAPDAGGGAGLGGSPTGSAGASASARIPADQAAIDEAYEDWVYHDGVNEIRAGAENVLGRTGAYDTGMGQRDVVEPLLGKKPMPNPKLREVAPELYDAKMAGIEAARGHGAAFLRGIRDGAPYEGDLWRGVDPTYDNGFHAGLRKGDTFDVSLMSTTPRRDSARGFDEGIMLHILPGAKTAHSTSPNFTTMIERGAGNWVEVPWEEVTGGRFEVVSRTKKTITLRQVAVFDPDNPGSR